MLGKLYTGLFICVQIIKLSQQRPSDFQQHLQVEVVYTRTIYNPDYSWNTTGYDCVFKAYAPSGHHIVIKCTLINCTIIEIDTMAPPSYSDLGKQARDIFGKRYHFGLWKLDCQTKTSSGIEFNTAGHSNKDSGKVFGSLETKYKVSDYGLTLTEKWNTDNTLFTEFALQDQLTNGLKLSFEGTFAPQSVNMDGTFKVAYGQENVKVDSDVNVDLAGPLVNASAVFGYQGWLAGYQTAFDTQKSKITTNNFALGYTTEDFVLHTSVNDGQEFHGSVFQRCSDSLDCGVQLSWTSGSNAIKFGIGGKYQLDSDAAVRAKVNNASQVGLGY